jgi:hypothetical protein
MALTMFSKKLIGMEMEYFDYMFYRVAKAYKRWDGDNNTTAKNVIGFAQGMIVCDLLLFPLIFFYGRDQLPFSGSIKIIAGVILLGSMFLSSRHYKNRYPALDEKWGNEESGHGFYKGLFVIIGLSLPLIAPILGAIYW